MRYKRPELGSHKFAYKGRRYWVIEISETENFNYHSRENANRRVWACVGSFFRLLLILFYSPQRFQDYVQLQAVSG